MAVTRGKSPVLMTAVNDVLNDPTDIARVWKVSEIRVVNGSNAGEVDIQDGNGLSVFANSSLGANAVDGTKWAYCLPVDQLKLVTWPTGCRAYIYYE